MNFASISLRTICLSMFLLGCNKELVDELLLEPNPDKENIIGELGPYGARMWTGTLEGSGDIELFVPEEINEGVRGLLVFGQGGAINVERYRWLGEHVASRGFIALTPVGFFDWGAFSSGDALHNAALALFEVSEVDEHPFAGMVSNDVPITYSGHSRGGVNAADAFSISVSDGQPASLVLLESYPNPDREFSGLEGLVVAIAGSKDDRVSVEKVEEGAAAFEDSIFVTVEGMNHYQLTDEPTEKELSKDGEATIETDVARMCTMIFLDAVLEESVTNDRTWLEDSANWPDCIKE